jgi:hypothetical protein
MKSLIIVVLTFTPCILFGQFTVDYHQSNFPFIGLGYELKDKLRPALRIGTNDFLEDISIEGVITYDVLNKEEYEFYSGIGIRTNNITGLVIPIGLNFYPFLTKNFGFQIEVTPIIGDEEILRGSWGIRYRFSRD